MEYHDFSQEEVRSILAEMMGADVDELEDQPFEVQISQVDPNRIVPGLKYY